VKQGNNALLTRGLLNNKQG
ncbi:hypothetical protein BMETH_21171611805, partial [methanotrophic bacterial endosymbiont of Bathymodiolus sp.]